MRKNEAKWVEARERWQINVQHDGKRKTFTSSVKGMKGKIAAEQAADKWLSLSGSVDDRVRCNMLLDNYISHLRENTSTAHATQYESMIKNWVRPVIGRKRLSDINDLDLEKILLNAHRAGRAKKTIQDLRGVLYSFCKYCRKRRLTTYHPEDIVIPARAKKSTRRTLTAAELQILFASDQTRFGGKATKDPYIYAYRFMVLTGARPGETVALQNINIKADRAQVRGSINAFGEATMGKNENAIRDLALPRLAKETLEQQETWLKERGIKSKYVFPNRYGLPVSQQELRDGLRRYCEYNGIDPVTPYELRHTFCSLNNSMPDGLKKLVMGHSVDFDTNGIYGHEIDGDLAAAGDCVDRSIARVLRKGA